MNILEGLERTKPIRSEIIQKNGKKFTLNIMPANFMRDAHVSGFAINDQAYISEDLEGSVKRFVTSHELYHLKDKQRWLGYFGMELRANLICGIKDPIGLTVTIIKGIKSRKPSLYFRRMFKNDSTLND